MLPIIVSAAIAATASPLCAAQNLTLSINARDGDFNGMSHSGTYLIVHNNGRRACRVPGMPAVTFYDDKARTIPTLRQTPLGMHPGPVVPPVTIQAGGNVATALRWVSGPVFDQNSSYEVRRVGVTIAGRPLKTRLRTTIFGRGGKAAMYSQAPLAVLPAAR